MVVATRAVHREPHRSFPDGADDLVEIIKPTFRIVFLTEQHARSHTQEPCRNEGLVGLPVHLVASDLFGEEQVVRLVLVERLDDVVAIAPCVGPMHVVLETTGVGVPRHVKPVAPVALAVVRRREKRIDQALPCLRGLVRHERGHLRRRRQQAEKVQVCPSHERQPVGARGGFQAAIDTSPLEEAIDRVREVLVGDNRQGRLNRQRERPVATLLGRDVHSLERRQ